MGISQRLRIVAPGSAIALVAAIVGTWMSLSSFLPTAAPIFAVRYAVSIALAPLFFLAPWMRSWAGQVASVPGYSSVAAAVAIIALPAHPAFPRRWTAVLTIVGLAAWMFCEFLLVAAAA